MPTHGDTFKFCSCHRQRTRKVVGYGALGAVGGAFPISNFHLVAFGNGDGVLEILVGVVGLYFDPFGFHLALVVGVVGVDLIRMIFDHLLRLTQLFHLSQLHVYLQSKSLDGDIDVLSFF